MIQSDFLAAAARGPISDQETVWPTLMLPVEELSKVKPVGRRSLTKTCGRSATPLLVTFRVKLTRVPSEPVLGRAVLATSILASSDVTVSVVVFVTLSPYLGLPATFKLFVRVP